MDEEPRVIRRSHLARVLGNELTKGRGRLLLGGLGLGRLSTRGGTDTQASRGKQYQDVELHGTASLLKGMAFWHAHTSTPPPAALGELAADQAPERH